MGTSVSEVSFLPTPMCVEHRSDQCHHIIEVINQGLDVAPLAEFIENGKNGEKFTLSIPLWPDHHMWEKVPYKVRIDPVFGPMGSRVVGFGGKISAFHESLNRVVPGDSIYGLTRVLRQQFEDLIELEWQGPGKGTFRHGCRSGSHNFKYQKVLDRLMADSGPGKISTILEPHLYALRTRDMCALCWADAYGNESRRVTGSDANIWPTDGALVDEAADFADLLPDSSMGKGRAIKSFSAIVEPSTDYTDYSMDLPF